MLSKTLVLIIYLLYMWKNVEWIKDYWTYEEEKNVSQINQYYLWILIKFIIQPYNLQGNPVTTNQYHAKHIPLVTSHLLLLSK